SKDILKNEGIIPDEILVKVFIKCAHPRLKNGIILLLEHFPPFGNIKIDRQPLIHWAIKHADLQTVEAIIENRYYINGVLNSESLTPLMAACKKGDLSLCKCLLANRKCLEMKDSQNRTAVFFALDHLDTLTWLHSIGADLMH